MFSRSGRVPLVPRAQSAGRNTAPQPGQQPDQTARSDGSSGSGAAAPEQNTDEPQQTRSREPQAGQTSPTAPADHSRQNRSQTGDEGETRPGSGRNHWNPENREPDTMKDIDISAPPISADHRGRAAL